MHLRLLIFLLLVSCSIPAYSTSLDFEGFPDGTILNTQISGLQFSNTLVLQAGLSLNEVEFPPHSGVNVIGDDGGPIEILFSTPISSFEGFFTYTTQITLSAFDTADSLLDSATSLFSENFVSSGNAPNEILTVSASGITRILIEGFGTGNSLVVDDITIAAIPEPHLLGLLLLGLGLLAIWTQGISRLGRSYCWVVSIFLLGLSGSTSIAWAEQGFQSIMANPFNVVKNVPTVVTVAAKPLPDPGLLPTSIRLQRQNGSQWQVVGTMVDNGTQGDAVAGDGIYTAQLTINASSGQVLLRASAGYRGSVRRVESSVATINLVDPLSLDVSSGILNVQMVVGETQNLAYFIQVGNDTGSPVTVQVTETKPSDGGLTVTSTNPGSFNVVTATTLNIIQVVTANTPGNYQLQMAGEIVGKGVTDSVTVNVKVLPSGLQATLLPLGSFPAGVGISALTNVLFTVSLVGSEGITADYVNLERLDPTGSTVVANLGKMVDDGTNGDLTDSDLVYSKTVPITENAAGVVYFRAVADVPGVGTVISPPFTLQVTPFPVGVLPPQPDQIITDPNTGEQVVANELLVTFVNGTMAAQIVSIAASINGTVVGQIVGAGVYQIRFSGDKTMNGLLSAAETLAANPLVASVELNMISSVSSFPDDPQLTSQCGPQKVRANEAWLIAKGKATIAVIDTGIDLNHEDLNSKIVKGHDYIQNDDEPQDEYGHGTHVAGIAAALSNNGKGITGISWDSKILAIRIFNATGGGASDAVIAQAIREAADKGAKVINCSFGGPAGGIFGLFDSEKKAVDYAYGKGALVVAAAGNSGNTTKRYPAAYDNAMAIANTTSTDNRAGDSNHGSWITMAAPGSGILSTSPTYAVTLNNPPTNLAQNYGTLSGTSMATPHVSGAAAVLWSIHPTWTPDQVRARLVATAKPLPGEDVGAGRLDLFEAVFNGNFEMSNLDEWSFTGTASVLDKLGPLNPPDGKKFAFVSTGPGGDNVATTLTHNFTVQPGVTALPIRFDYNFVTEEYPEFVGTEFNDSLTIVVIAPDGSTTTLAAESVNGSNFSAINDIDFPGGDDTVGQTGWKKASASIPITAGPGIYRVFITDAGDDIYDSAVLIDHIELK